MPDVAWEWACKALVLAYSEEVLQVWNDVRCRVESDLTRVVHLSGQSGGSGSQSAPFCYGWSRSYGTEAAKAEGATVDTTAPKACIIVAVQPLDMIRAISGKGDLQGCLWRDKMRVDKLKSTREGNELRAKNCLPMAWLLSCVLCGVARFLDLIFRKQRERPP